MIPSLVPRLSPALFFAAHVTVRGSKVTYVAKNSGRWPGNKAT